MNGLTYYLIFLSFFLVVCTHHKRRTLSTETQEDTNHKEKTENTETQEDTNHKEKTENTETQEDTNHKEKTENTETQEDTNHKEKTENTETQEDTNHKEKTENTKTQEDTNHKEKTENTETQEKTNHKKKTESTETQEKTKNVTKNSDTDEEHNNCTTTSSSTFRTRSYKFGAEVISKATRFVPEVIDATCTLIPEKGPCRGEIPMYYFAIEDMKCKVFVWGGCQGNGNRFDTLEECLGTCVSSHGYKKGRPKFCQLTFDYGWCFGAEKRWYYDHRWKICKSTIYSGCGGNKNNFYNKEQCTRVCGFGQDPFTTEATVNKSGIYKRIIINPISAELKRETAPPN